MFHFVASACVCVVGGGGGACVRAYVQVHVRNKNGRGYGSVFDDRLLPLQLRQRRSTGALVVQGEKWDVRYTVYRLALPCA